MLLVLDIYDLIKKVKSSAKIEKRLDAKDPRPHPCDLAVKDYGLVDHKQGVAKEL